MIKAERRPDCLNTMNPSIPVRNDRWDDPVADSYRIPTSARLHVSLSLSLCQNI